MNLCYISASSSFSYMSFHTTLTKILSKRYIIGLVAIFILAIASSFVESHSDITFVFISATNKVHTGMATLALGLTYIIANYSEVLKELNYNPLTLLISAIISLMISIALLTVGVVLIGLTNRSIGVTALDNNIIYYYIVSGLSTFVVMTLVIHVAWVIDSTSERITITLQD